MRLTREQAFAILKKHMSNKNLINHSLAAEGAMRGLAKHFGEDEEKWGVVGLLHDGDYEETGKDITKHTKLMVQWLQEEGEQDEDVMNAIASHAYAHTGENPPSTKLEWGIFCADELTGLIVGCALVQPDKKLASVTVDSVIKKFHTKQFCANVNRDSIAACEKELGIKLPEFIEIVLKSMREIAPIIGYLS